MFSTLFGRSGHRPEAPGHPRRGSPANDGPGPPALRARLRA